jgi:hypothetical protein
VKKIITAITIFFGLSSFAFAEIGAAVGISGTGGLYDATGTERITGTATGGKYHNNDVNTYAFQEGKLDTSTKSNKKAKSDMLIAYGSVFGEVWVNPMIRLGVEFLPSDLESDTTENKRNDLCSHDQSTTYATCVTSTNKVKVEISDLTTAYIALHHPDNGLYVRTGYMTAKLITNESLATGSSYGNTNLYGVMAGVGYEKDLPNGMFIRGEITQTEIEGVALYNTGSNNQNHISVEGISGTSGLISVGKSF